MCDAPYNYHKVGELTILHTGFPEARECGNFVFGTQDRWSSCKMSWLFCDSLVTGCQGSWERCFFSLTSRARCHRVLLENVFQNTHVDTGKTTPHASASTAKGRAGRVKHATICAHFYDKAHCVMDHGTPPRLPQVAGENPGHIQPDGLLPWVVCRAPAAARGGNRDRRADSSAPEAMPAQASHSTWLCSRGSATRGEEGKLRAIAWATARQIVHETLQKALAT